MITPSFSLAATERVMPRMMLDFTTAALDARVALTRTGNTATTSDSSGNLAVVNADLPRFYYNPSTLASQGLLIEETRTNLLLNSLINGTNLATQSVTVTAASHTLSFYGTGSVALSGTHTATVNGSGAYPTRTTYTFTPTAGTLTLTVTGTVQYANLELGAFATSFIPTDGTTKTRNQDVVTMTGTNFSSWFNATEGSLVTSAFALGVGTGTNVRLAQIDDGTENNRILTAITSTPAGRYIATAGGSLRLDTSVSYSAGAQVTVAGTYKNASYTAYVNTVQGTSTAATGVPSSLTLMRIGASTTGVQGSRVVSKIWYYPQRLTNSELQAFSK